MVLNRFPWWKNVLIVVIVLSAFIYALPNIYVEDPSVQISPASPATILDQPTLEKVVQALQKAELPYKQIQPQNRGALIRFSSTDVQLKAKDLIQDTLGEAYIVALNLATATPNWLRSIGAMTMKLGLDLRGGVHLLLQVGIDSVIKQRIEGDLSNIGQELRNQHIRYSGLTLNATNGMTVQFREQTAMDDARSYLSQHFSEFVWTKDTKSNGFVLQGLLSPLALQQLRQDTLDQEMNILRNRVNELGVSEAVVQQQGGSRVMVELPGIQDTAQAKNILGKTATLEFHMVDTEHDVRGVTPPDTKIYPYNGGSVLLKNQIILHGSSITSATSSVGEDGRPSVNVRLDGGGIGLFTKTTAENIGKPMAALYVDVHSETKEVNGQKVINYQTERKVISVATIQNALGNMFQITGLSSPEEARTLALLLRAGALPAHVTIIEERQIGPSLGKQNIHKGVMSVAVGFICVVIFMALYYGVMGLIADLALTMNLVLIVAILSLLGATITLPGIAGMVLTMGMAVDANVLIFERIREELRHGVGIQASIHAGYERALTTIIDANMTL